LFEVIAEMGCKITIYLLTFEANHYLTPVTTMSLQSPSFKSARFVFNAVLDKLQARPMSILYSTGAIVGLFAGRPFLALVCLAMVVFSNPLLIWQLQGRYRQVLKRYRLNAVLLTGIIFGLLAGLTLCFSFVDPSHAQFFFKAETFLTTTLGGSTGLGSTSANVIKLVMNTLRVMFVMYMLFGVVQVFQAVRQGEEWKDLARTPFFVMLAGTLGDVLVGAIVLP
jgi:hypothetical protein